MTHEQTQDVTDREVCSGLSHATVSVAELEQWQFTTTK